jgi:hypothetical protein
LFSGRTFKRSIDWLTRVRSRSLILTDALTLDDGDCAVLVRLSGCWAVVFEFALFGCCAVLLVLEFVLLGCSAVRLALAPPTGACWA